MKDAAIPHAGKQTYNDDDDDNTGQQNLTVFSAYKLQ
jgi:hypothetical protein